MQTSSENAPEIIFEWLSRPFKTLNEEQRSLVLRYFSEAEYRDMHLAMMAIGEKQNPDSYYRIKQDLLAEFDKKYSGSGKVVGLFRRVNVWRAAAAIFFAVSAWFAAGLLRPEEFIRSKTITVTDTIYLEKKYFDTVLVPVIPREMRVSANEAIKPSMPAESLTGHYEIKPETLHVLSLKALDEEENVQKGNSLQDDSLISNFNFITL